MAIVFHHPPVPGSTNPLVDFDPSNKNHYPQTNGVYVYGFRIKVDDMFKFAPAYVGIAFNDTLENRLFNHHYKNNQSCSTKHGKGYKELWDFASIRTAHDLAHLYAEMHYYDNINNYTSGFYRTSSNYMEILTHLRCLLYFNNKNYFIMKRGGAFNELNASERELNHCDAIDGMFDVDKRIQNMKALFTKDFYYIYSTFDEILNSINEEKNSSFLGTSMTVQSILEHVERIVKRALNTIGVHTTAKSNSAFLDNEVDFTQIQKELVNVGGHSFNLGGHYSRLIIPIRS